MIFTTTATLVVDLQVIIEQKNALISEVLMITYVLFEMLGLPPYAMRIKPAISEINEKAKAIANHLIEIDWRLSCLSVKIMASKVVIVDNRFITQ
jgi:hypothetical protein